MHWLKEAVTNGRTKIVSVKRVVHLMAGTALSLSTVVLSAAACWKGIDVAPALGAVTLPLAGLAGYGYVNGKRAEAQARDGAQ